MITAKRCFCAPAAFFIALSLSSTAARAEWEAPATIDVPPEDPFGATFVGSALAAGANGLVTVLFFQKGPDTQPLNSTTGSPFAARRAGGALPAWGTPEAIATPAAGQRTTGVVPAVTSRRDGGTVSLFAYSPSGGSTQTLASNWTAGAAAPSAALPLLCTADAPPKCIVSDLQVALDAVGNAYATGRNAPTGSNGDLLFARTDPASGAWQAAQVVQVTVNTPRLAVDSGGNVVLAYVRNDPSANGVRLFGRRMTANADVFGADVLLSGPNLVSPSGGVRLILDDDGTATVIFLENIAPGPLATSTELRAARWPLAASPMAAQTLSASGGTVLSIGALALDPARRITAAWAAPRAGIEASTIYTAQFINGQWSAAEIRTPEQSATNFTGPELAADDAGTLTLIYRDNAAPGATNKLFVQRKAVDGPWSAMETISVTAMGTGNVQGNSYNVAARKPGQADVTFVQTLDGVNRLFATRFLDDSTAPVITVTTPQDGATYTRGNTVNASYGCVDESGGSGIASCVGSVASGQPIDTGTLGVRQFTVTATDVAGNTATRIVNYTVQADTAAPAIIITTPQNGATYSLQQAVNADYACQDESSGSGIAACAGTVADGQPIDTQTPGTKTFTVTATDIAGNSAVMDVQYTVQAPPAVPPPDPPPEQPPGLQSNNTFFGGSLGLYAALVLLLASGLRRARLRCRYV